MANNADEKDFEVSTYDTSIQRHVAASLLQSLQILINQHVDAHPNRSLAVALALIQILPLHNFIRVGENPKPLQQTVHVFIISDHQIHNNLAQLLNSIGLVFQFHCNTMATQESESIHWLQDEFVNGFDIVSATVAQLPQLIDRDIRWNMVDYLLFDGYQNILKHQSVPDFCQAFPSGARVVLLGSAEEE